MRGIVVQAFDGIPDYAAHIIDSGQFYTIVFVSFDELVIWSFLQRKFKTFVNGSHFLTHK